ncbi:MAG: hypothetical protein GC172_09435 [Phycisphaera sp.]|nr:hypothetical protein [Phycisphaera sp.]
MSPGARTRSVAQARALAFMLCALSLVAFHARPQDAPDPPSTTPLELIEAGDPSVRRFGDGVAASGSLLAIAAPTDGDDAWSPGFVAIHRVLWTARDGVEVVEEARFSSSLGAEGEHFGAAVAASVLQPTGHSPAQTAIPPMRGDLVAVGADRADVDLPAGPPIPMAGAVDLFERAHRGAPRWGRSARLRATSPQPGAEFGGALAFDAGGAARLAVGSARHDARAGIDAPWVWDAGRVHVFTRHGDAAARGGAARWSEAAVIDPPRPELSGWFGASVAIEGELLAIGSPGHDVPRPDGAGTISNAGAVFLYRRIASDPAGGAPLERYRLERVFTAPEPEESAWFGLAIALEDEALAIGAPRAAGTRADGERRGAVYHFDLARPQSHPKRIDPPSERVRTGFGQTLALRRGTLLIGAPSTDAPSAAADSPMLEDVGGAWIYALDDGAFTAELVPPRATRSVLFGATAALAWPGFIHDPMAWSEQTARECPHGAPDPAPVAVVGHRYTEEESQVPSPGAALYRASRVKAPP